MADVIDRDGFTTDICVVRLPFGDDQVEHPCNPGANQLFRWQFSENDRLRKSGEGDVTFWSDEIKSAHKHGAYGDISVYTFFKIKGSQASPAPTGE